MHRINFIGAIHSLPLHISSSIKSLKFFGDFKLKIASKYPFKVRLFLKKIEFKKKLVVRSFDSLINECLPKN
jgi:hypothetical protein